MPNDIQERTLKWVNATVYDYIERMKSIRDISQVEIIRWTDDMAEETRNPHSRYIGLEVDLYAEPDDGFDIPDEVIAVVLHAYIPYKGWKEETILIETVDIDEAFLNSEELQRSKRIQLFDIMDKMIHYITFSDIWTFDKEYLVSYLRNSVIPYLESLGYNTEIDDSELEVLAIHESLGYSCIFWFTGYKFSAFCKPYNQEISVNILRDVLWLVLDVTKTLNNIHSKTEETEDGD